MIAGTVPYQHAGTPAWLIPARLPLWYMEAIASMYTILASIGCGPHVSSSRSKRRGYPRESSHIVVKFCYRRHKVVK